MYRLTQERGGCPYLTPSLESVGDKMKETDPLLIKQGGGEFLQNKLEQTEKKGGNVHLLSEQHDYQQSLEGSCHRRF